MSVCVSDLEADLNDASQHGHLGELNDTEDLNLVREQLLDVTQQTCVNRAGHQTHIITR